MKKVSTAATKRSRNFSQSRGAAASFVGKWRSVRAVAQQQPHGHASGGIKQKHCEEGKINSTKPSSGDCVYGLAQLH